MSKHFVNTSAMHHLAVPCYREGREDWAEEGEASEKQDP